MAIAAEGLASPTFSDMPKGVPFGNSTEERVVKRAWAIKTVEGVKRSIKACDSESQLIIVSVAIQGKSRDDVQDLVKYEHSQYYLKQRKAYNQFADAFEVQDNGIDLHCYLENGQKADE